ncbi:MAG TPA: hypothetical protein VGQ88_04815 [Burkholderiales bacterium]|nr:hypothetical protein [Burkholderiales bacterium]
MVSYLDMVDTAFSHGRELWDRTAVRPAARPAAHTIVTTLPVRLPP